MLVSGEWCCAINEGAPSVLSKYSPLVACNGSVLIQAEEIGTQVNSTTHTHQELQRAGLRHPGVRQRAPQAVARQVGVAQLGPGATRRGSLLRVRVCGWERR